jgi:hypothetical protein
MRPILTLVFTVALNSAAFAFDDAAYDAAYAECSAQAEAAGARYIAVFDACMSAKGFTAAAVDTSIPMDDR